MPAVFDFKAIQHARDVMKGAAPSGTFYRQNSDNSVEIVSTHPWDIGTGRCSICGVSMISIEDGLYPLKCSGPIRERRKVHEGRWFDAYVVPGGDMETVQKAPAPGFPGAEKSKDDRHREKLRQHFAAEVKTASDHAVDRAFEEAAEIVTVATNNHDHPVFIGGMRSGDTVVLQPGKFYEMPISKQDQHNKDLNDAFRALLDSQRHASYAGGFGQQQVARQQPLAGSAPVQNPYGALGSLASAPPDVRDAVRAYQYKQAFCEHAGYVTTEGLGGRICSNCGAAR